MLLHNVDYQVHLYNLHGLANEAVMPNEDGSYTILIESSLLREQQQHAFLHAMAHIYNNDFEKECSVDLLEREAHFT